MTERDVEHLRTAIEKAGGLVTLADVARDLGVTTQRLHQIADAGDLPDPVAAVGGRKLWARDQIESWRQSRAR